MTVQHPELGHPNGARSHEAHAHPVASSARRWLRMVGYESRVLLRRRTTVLTILCGPALMIFFPVVLPPQDPVGWAVLAGVSGLIGLLISTYATTTSVLTLRRESGVLNRQRTMELSGAQIVTALAAPLFVIGVLQTLAVYAVYLLLGAPVPARPDLIVLAALLGAGFCAAAAAVTSISTRSAESSQWTTMPLLLGASIGANLVTSPMVGDGVRLWLAALPGVSLADLVARGWSGDAAWTASLPTLSVLLDVGLLVGWALVATLLARRRWRWTARD